MNQQPPRQFINSLRQLATGPAPATITPAVLGELGLADRYFALPGLPRNLLIAFSNLGITAVRPTTDEEDFRAWYQAQHGRPLYRLETAPAALQQAIQRQLAGERNAVQFDLRGCSEFEQATLRKALEIPRGEVRPYGWIASEIGRPGAVRAVGSALGHNPVPVLIPCHRIVRSDGQIGNYAFGPELKEQLLQSEGLDIAGFTRLAKQGIHYLGSDTTQIYCFPTCRCARRITPHHQITFASTAAAERAGYRPCLVCRPGRPAATATG